MSNTDLLKIVVIDEKAIVGKIIRKALNSENVVIVDQFSTFEASVNCLINHQPEIVVLDYDLFGPMVKDVAEWIRELSPKTEIVLTSVKHTTLAKSSLKALELGALYFIRKSVVNNFDETVQYYKKYLLPIINLMFVRESSERISATRPAVEFSQPPKLPATDPDKIIHHGSYDIMLIASSLGGPDALLEFLPKLPADFRIPILVVQHMPANFTASLAQKLNENSDLIVQEAKQGTLIQPGTIHLAPGGQHLLLKKIPGKSGQFMTILNDREPVGGCRPSADLLFGSVANNFNGNVLAVVLTGMGSDGTIGVRNLKENLGCFCITQTKNSCAVYGMPQSVDNAGLSDLSLPIDKMAPAIAQIVNDKKSTQKV